MDVSSLSDIELLSIVLSNGERSSSALSVAESVLPIVDKAGNKLTSESFVEISGICKKKAFLLTASLEFARRRIRPKCTKIREAADAWAIVKHLADRSQEHFICISLNGANEVIAHRVVTIGLANSSQVHPREVFADVILDRACAVIVAHNHPSGNLVPSVEDIKVTKILKESGKILGINLLDHLIFCTDGYYSFAEDGEL